MFQTGRLGLDHTQGNGPLKSALKDKKNGTMGRFGMANALRMVKI